MNSVSEEHHIQYADDYHNQEATHDARVAEYNRLCAVGRAALPGVRSQDAEEAGRIWEWYQAGNMLSEQWDEYVHDMKESHKVNL